MPLKQFGGTIAWASATVVLAGVFLHRGGPFGWALTSAATSVGGGMAVWTYRLALREHRWLQERDRLRRVAGRRKAFSRSPQLLRPRR